MTAEEIRDRVIPLLKRSGLRQAAVLSSLIRGEDSIFEASVKGLLFYRNMLLLVQDLGFDDELQYLFCPFDPSLKVINKVRLTLFDRGYLTVKSCADRFELPC
ncbi:MAG: hypothetical protein ABSA46_04045 [Thermodesulfovibrionales bacterium]|jgi:hypothetical protein